MKRKARLIAREFTQVYEINYLETFASIAKMSSVRILFAVAAIKDLEVHQMNVVTAFLTEDLDEEIYMKQSEGFEVEDGDEDLICLFEKSLYELKQAARL